MKQIILLLLIIILFSTTMMAEEMVYPTTIGWLSAEATLIGSGNVSELKEGEEARLQTITFPQTEYQTVKIIKEELHINGKTIHPKQLLDEFGNKHLMFYIKENGDFDYIISADINRKAFAFNTEDYNITEPQENVSIYTQPTEKVESNSIEILTLANNKIFGTTFVSTLDQTVDWVNNYVEYATGEDFRIYYLEQKSAVETLLSRKGVCDEFTNLGAAILRAKNVPTRIVIGITFDGVEWGNHAWIEVYNTKLNKWIPADPTFREAGFVDAMHIEMGVFDDVTGSKAKCFYPSTAKCTIENQATMPEVKIKQKNYFENIILDTNTTTLKTNAWNDIYIKMTNTTNGVVNAPIKMRNIKNVLIRNNKKSLILQPGETKTAIFKVLPKISLEQNQIAKGQLVFNSLSTPYEQEVTVMPNDEEYKGDFVIEDLTPIAHEGTLKIQVTVTNYYEEDKTIDLNITGKEYEDNSVETIPKLSTRIITKEIENYTNTPYEVNISTPNQILNSEIIPIKAKLSETREPKQTIIEQKLPQATQKESITETMTNNPLAIIMGLFAGITVLLFGLFLVNKRYL